MISKRELAYALKRPRAIQMLSLCIMSVLSLAWQSKSFAPVPSHLHVAHTRYKPWSGHANQTCFDHISCSMGLIPVVNLVLLSISSGHTSPFLLLTLPHLWVGRERTRSWEGPWPGQLTPADQRESVQYSVARFVYSSKHMEGTKQAAVWLLAATCVLGTGLYTVGRINCPLLIILILMLRTSLACDCS